MYALKCKTTHIRRNMSLQLCVSWSRTSMYAPGEMLAAPCLARIFIVLLRVGVA